MAQSSAPSHALKKAILDSKDVLMSVSDQATAPSKNFYNLLITREGVIFRLWLINPAVALHHADASKSATEDYCTLEDFLLGDLQEKIRQVSSAVLPKAIEVVTKALGAKPAAQH